jgi:hypothetical protein
MSYKSAPSPPVRKKLVGMAFKFQMLEILVVPRQIYVDLIFADHPIPVLNWDRVVAVWTTGIDGMIVQ